MTVAYKHLKLDTTDFGGVATELQDTKIIAGIKGSGLWLLKQIVINNLIKLHGYVRYGVEFQQALLM